MQRADLNPLTMKDLHPVEACILAGILATLALLELARAGLSLVLLLIRLARSSRQPSPRPVAAAPAPAPWRHPLEALGAELVALPAAELRAVVGTRRRCAKAELVANWLAMPI